MGFRSPIRPVDLAARAAAAQALTTAEAAAQAAADAAAAAASAAADADAAAAIADGKITTWVRKLSTDAYPTLTAGDVGDLLIDQPNGNALLRWQDNGAGVYGWASLPQRVIATSPSGARAVLSQTTRANALGGTSSVGALDLYGPATTSADNAASVQFWDDSLDTNTGSTLLRLLAGRSALFPTKLPPWIDLAIEAAGLGTTPKSTAAVLADQFRIPKQVSNGDAMQFADTGWTAITPNTGWTKVWGAHRILNGRYDFAIHFTAPNWGGTYKLYDVPTAAKPTVPWGAAGVWQGAGREVGIAAGATALNIVGAGTGGVVVAGGWPV